MSQPNHIEKYSLEKHPNNALVVSKTPPASLINLQKAAPYGLIAMTMAFAAVITVELITKQATSWNLLIQSSCLLLAIFTFYLERHKATQHQGFSFQPDNSLTTPKGETHTLTNISIRQIKGKFAVIAIADHYHHTIAILHSKVNAESLLKQITSQIRSANNMSQP
jgi:hypothetical protein